VVLITGNSFESVNEKLSEVKSMFSSDGVSSITEVATLAGDVRPGDQKGHEQYVFITRHSFNRSDFAQFWIQGRYL
jgi:hypothetical protein